MTFETSSILPLIESWEIQQNAYVTHRDERFNVMLDTVDQCFSEPFTVVDLGCGTGSISARVLARFPSATCIGLDYDPILLQIAQDRLAGYGPQFVALDFNLAEPGLADVLGIYKPQAVLTSTALHWLTADKITQVYIDCAEVLPSSGILLNADHLRQLRGRPLLRTLGEQDDQRTQQHGLAEGAPTWEDWFAEALSYPRYARFKTQRQDRFPSHKNNPHLSLEYHVEALYTAGFSEAGSIWQYLDDYVILAQK